MTSTDESHFKLTCRPRSSSTSESMAHVNITTQIWEHQRFKGDWDGDLARFADLQLDANVSDLAQKSLRMCPDVYCSHLMTLHDSAFYIPHSATRKIAIDTAPSPGQTGSCNLTCGRAACPRRGMLVVNIQMQQGQTHLTSLSMSEYRRDR